MAIVTVLAAIWLYEPLYPDIEDIGKLRMIIALKKVLTVVGTISESLGFISQVNLTRSMSHILLPKPAPFENLEIRDDNFSGVPVRIFRPIHKDKSSSEELPGLVFFHGGGWVLLDVDVYHSLTAEMAQETGFVVVSVDYRLAPENKFPIPFDDCLTATVHLLRHGQDYGVDVTRIAVSGDSAGGNLAAAVALRLTVESGLPSLKSQVLIYPALQAFDFRMPSVLTRQLPGFLTQKSLVDYWLLYYQGNTANAEEFLNNNHTSAILKASEYADIVHQSLLPEKYRKEIDEKPLKNYGNEKLSDAFEPTLLNPYFCPLLSQRVEALPPTLMITAEYDVLRDDGFIYAKRLAEDGVTVKHEHFKNSFHGFISIDGSDSQKKFLVLLAKFLK